ncbi:MAG: hypothetical protein L6Q92_13230 [Phycisphaerae bacterium]|nr:hypothetical protein [Phycisphaerae bacterium]
MGYESRDGQDELVRRVDFAYDLAGHASYMLVADAGEPVRVIRHPVGTDDYAASVLYYDSAGRVWPIGIVGS